MFLLLTLSIELLVGCQGIYGKVAWKEFVPALFPAEILFRVFVHKQNFTLELVLIKVPAAPFFRKMAN